MKIQIQCPHCEKTLKVEKELSGRKVKCPGCKSPFVVNLEPQSPPPNPRTLAVVPAVGRKEANPKNQIGNVTEHSNTKTVASKTRNTLIAVSVVVVAGVSVVFIAGYFLKPTQRGAAKIVQEPPVPFAESTIVENPNVETPVIPVAPVVPIGQEDVAEAKEQNADPKDTVLPSKQSIDDSTSAVTNRTNTNTIGRLNGKDPEELSVQDAIALALKRLKDDYQNKLDQIATDKGALKQAMILDDRNAIAQIRRKIEGYQKELLLLTNNPFRSLDPLNFEKGKIGNLATYRFQAFDGSHLEKGEVVGTLWDEKILPGKTSEDLKADVKIRGMDEKLAKVAMSLGIKFKPEDNFVVLGKTIQEFHLQKRAEVDYHFPCFLLHACAAVAPFTEDERKAAREATNPDYTIALSEDEEAQAKIAREANDKLEMEKTQVVKTRRSKTFLDSAKKLLDKNQRSSARKLLEKAVVESPDSEPGEEASKLLKTLE
jgi:hypothetical protein